MTREELADAYAEVLGLHATSWRMSTCMALADGWALSCHAHWGEVMKLKPAGKTQSLNRMAKTGRPWPSPRHCRSCLAEAELDDAGYCTGRAACETRQPALFDVYPARESEITL